MKLRSFWAVTWFAFFSIPSITFADDSATTNNFIGFGFGGNFSSFSTENPSVNNNTEFTANIFTDWGLGGIWYLQTGLRYTSYGLNGSDAGFDYRETVHYLEIPVLIKPTFDAGGWFPYFLAGPSLDFKVGEDISSNTNGESVEVAPDFFKTLNFLVDFGAGVELPVAPGFRAYLQFDYALGLVNVFNYESLGGTHTRGAIATAGAMVTF